MSEFTRLERFAFLEHMVIWYEGVTAKQVAEVFGVTRPNAQRLIKSYSEMHPENLIYDKSKKKKIASKDFSAHYLKESSELFMGHLKAGWYTKLYRESSDWEEINIEDARESDPECEVGDSLGIKLGVADLGRIAAQTAKQVIIQKIRDAEREMTFNEFKDRKGELITGIVRRFEKGNIIVDLGRAEAILPKREQVQTETYRQGDRIQAYVLDITRASKSPQVVLTRTHPGLLMKLFELEVPEIYEGIVRIEIARIGRAELCHIGGFVQFAGPRHGVDHPGAAHRQRLQVADGQRERQRRPR